MQSIGSLWYNGTVDIGLKKHLIQKIFEKKEMICTIIA